MEVYAVLELYSFPGIPTSLSLGSHEFQVDADDEDCPLSKYNWGTTIGRLGHATTTTGSI